MPDANEPLGQDVQEEAAEELDRIERHHAWLVPMRIIAPTEGDALSIKGQQAMIRDGNAVSVPAKIAQYLLRSAEGRLGIDNPVLAAQTSHQLGKLLAFAKYGSGSSVAELFPSIETLQAVDELAAKDAP